MKKFTPILLVLFCLICLSASVKAEDGCKHENAENHYIDYYDNELWHIIECPDCGESKHIAKAEYSNDADYHRVYCTECDFYGTDYHYAVCGEDKCAACGAENVEIAHHINHPEGSEIYVYCDEDCHTESCGVCGDKFSSRVHFQNCDGSERCADCGAEGVIFAFSDHVVINFVDFDKTYCYYACSCGEFHYEVWHGIYCDSEDRNTCAECGKNVEKDGIVISDIWHDTLPGYDENYCWTKCTECGYMPYFGEHYTGCDDDDDTRCDNCGRTGADGINLVWKHTYLDHEWCDEDGTAMHRQVCWDCGYEGETHEADSELTFYSIEGDTNNHNVKCSGCEFDWQEYHYAVCGEDKCTACGAEDVTFAYRTDHPEDNVIYDYYDEDEHKIYCSICGDVLDFRDHVLDCSDPDHCKYCGAEDVFVDEIMHNTYFIDFDAEHCYYSCACGEEAYDWRHVVYCDPDQSTCVGCGKSVEADGIVISVIWHHDNIEHNEYECWNTCDNCGELYRGEHYYSCDNEEQMYCSYCGSSNEEVDIQTFRHVDIDMNDVGDGWHDPWCTYCGAQLAGLHEYILFFAYGSYEQCHVYCDICGYLTDWGHQGQCGEPNEHTYCIRCGAEDVCVVSHDNHLATDAVSCVDENCHLFYCSVCGDEHYRDEHKSAVGSYEDFGTCVVCGAEDVNLYGQLTYEERIEDGIRICINYNEDGSKHIDYFDVQTNDYCGWEWYEHWEDEQPADWEYRTNIEYNEWEDMYSFDYTTPWGYGTKTRRISDEMLIREKGFDGNCFFETVWDYEEEVVIQKIYTNPDDDSTYAERILDEGGNYTWQSFTVKGVTYMANKDILKMPLKIQVIEAEAFANVPAHIVILNENITSIASDAFSSDTVLLVPNETVAELVKEAGYVWFFN